MGAHVTALASSKTLAAVQELGADAVLDYATTSPKALVSFDVILDTVGSEAWNYRSLLAPKGRMITICPDPKRPLMSFLYIFASTIFGSRRVRFFNAKPTKGVLADFAAFLEQGAIRPLVDAVYPLSDIGLAHPGDGNRRTDRQANHLVGLGCAYSSAPDETP